MGPGQKGNHPKDRQQKGGKVDCCVVLRVGGASGTAFAHSVLLPCSLMFLF